MMIFADSLLKFPANWMLMARRCWANLYLNDRFKGDLNVNACYNNWAMIFNKLDLKFKAYYTLTVFG